MAWRCRFLTARRSQDGLLSDELVDFHTGKDLRGVGQARDVLRDVEARRVQGGVQGTGGARDARDRVVLRDLGARRVGEAEATARRIVLGFYEIIDVIQIVLEII